MFRLGYIFVLPLLFSVCTSFHHAFPSDIERCKYWDGHCLSRVVTSILRLQYKGHQGLNVVAFEPLPVDKIVLQKIPGSPVNMEFKFENVKMIGNSWATVLNLTGFTKEASDVVVEMKLHYPKLIMTGPYHVDGCVLTHPITGQGDSRIYFEDMIVVAKAKCSRRVRNGEAYLNIDDVQLDLQPKRVAFALDNLFNGDKVQGDKMNRLLNDNWRFVFSVLKPMFEKPFARIARNVANGPFSAIPYSNLFL